MSNSKQNATNHAACLSAIKAGKLKKLQKLLQVILEKNPNSMPLDERACAAAAARGDLSLLVWLRTSGPKLEDQISFGDSFVWPTPELKNECVLGLGYALLWPKNSSPSGAANISRIEKRGMYHLAALASRHDINELISLPRPCPWDKSTYKAAADNGHLELLAWAHANGCPSEKTKNSSQTKQATKTRA